MQDSLRGEVAREAARLMCEQGIRDFAFAKQKALASLGRGHGPAPSNLEIADCVREHLQIFEPQASAERLQELRQTAVRAMRLCGQFQPRAVGAVVNGVAPLRSVVQIHVFCPYDEALDLFLAEQNIPFDSAERHFRLPNGQEINKPVCAFLAGETEVEVAIFEEGDLRWSPVSPVDGKPMQRWTIGRLEKSLSQA